MDEPKSPEEVVTHILDAFRRTYQEAAEALNSIADTRQAFDTITDFDERLRTLHNQQVPLLRALQTRRERKQRPGASLADLALHFNRSKSRMKQFDDLASQAEEASCTGSATQP